MTAELVVPEGVEIIDVPKPEYEQKEILCIACGKECGKELEILHFPIHHYDFDNDRMIREYIPFPQCKNEKCIRFGLITNVSISHNGDFEIAEIDTTPVRVRIMKERLHKGDDNDE